MILLRILQVVHKEAWLSIAIVCAKLFLDPNKVFFKQMSCVSISSSIRCHVNQMQCVSVGQFSKSFSKLKV
jgi:hypothetical protein